MRNTGVACRSTNSRKSASLTEVDSRACMVSATTRMSVRLATPASRDRRLVVRVALPDEFAVVGHLVVRIDDGQILVPVAATDHVGGVIAVGHDEVIVRTAVDVVHGRSPEDGVGTDAAVQGVLSGAT